MLKKEEKEGWGVIKTRRMNELRSFNSEWGMMMMMITNKDGENRLQIIDWDVFFRKSLSLYCYYYVYDDGGGSWKLIARFFISRTYINGKVSNMKNVWMCIMNGKNCTTPESG